MALNAKQQAFVEAYIGNATEAARVAGYKGTQLSLAVTGSRLLRNAKVRAAIDARGAKATKVRIATREERQAFWTRVQDDELAKMTDRLKASELLGKSEADFTERVQHSGAVSIAVVDPYAKPQSQG